MRKNPRNVDQRQFFTVFTLPVILTFLDIVRRDMLWS